MARRPSGFGGLLPFRLEIPLRLKADQQRIERAGFHAGEPREVIAVGPLDRKSTRLNSSYVVISYAVFCLKRKIIKLSDLRWPVRFDGLPPVSH